jgi:hypothetical protein
VKWAVGIVAAAVIAFGVAAVMLTRSDEPEPGLNDADLGWVRKYEPWRSATQAELQAAYKAATVVATPEDVAALVDRIKGCTASYRALGPAPGALADVAEPSVRACGIVQSVAARFQRTRTVADASRKTSIKLAAAALATAHARLLDHFRLTRVLPTSDDADESRVEPRLTAYATQLVSANVDVRCWSEKDWRDVERELDALAPDQGAPERGAAGVWSGAAQLSPSVCARLLAVAGESPDGAPDATVRALDTLGHAVSHATGTLEEAGASCDGLQSVRPFATDLGAGARGAAQLAARAWTLYRAHDLGAWSPECRSGGPLDRNLSGAWP